MRSTLPLIRSDAVRLAALAAVITVVIMAIVFWVAGDGLSADDAGTAAYAVPPPPIVQTAPAWVADPVAPVTIAPGA